MYKKAYNIRYIIVITLIFIFFFLIPAIAQEPSLHINPAVDNEKNMSAQGSDMDNELESVSLQPEEKGNIRAQLLPLVETTLSSEIASRIEKIEADMGDRFASGKQLILFDCEMYKVQLQKAKADLDEASKTLEVNRRLDKLKSISEIEMAVSIARMNRAKAELKLREAQVRKCVIHAPFTGRVVKRKANPFEYVSPGEPLLEIIDDVNLILQLLVPSHWLKWIKKKDTFTVHIDETGKDYTAIVTALGAKVDPVSQTLEIRAKINGKNSELLPGMSGTAYFKQCCP